MNKIEISKAKLDEMQTLTAATAEVLKSIKVVADMKSDEHEKKMWDMIYSATDYLHRRIDSIWTELYKHYDGHLPSTKSAEQLQRAIDKLGLSDEYSVQKKVIYASERGRPVLEVDLNYVKPKN